MKVKILSSTEMLYDGYATTVSSINDVGEFDILAKHANFISLIKQAVILNKGLDTEKYFRIDKGVLKVANEVVDIFV